MTEVRFSAIVGEDGVIHVPAGVSIPGGMVEVTVRSDVARRSPDETNPTDQESIGWLLAIAAESEATEGPPLPDDLAENHDHYAHGPRSDDRDLRRSLLLHRPSEPERSISRKGKPARP